MDPGIFHSDVGVAALEELVPAVHTEPGCIDLAGLPLLAKKLDRDLPSRRLELPTACSLEPGLALIAAVLVVVVALHESAIRDADGPARVVELRHAVACALDRRHGAVLTGGILVAFVGGAAYVYSGKRKPEFVAPSRLPLEEDQSENTP